VDGGDAQRRAAVLSLAPLGLDIPVIGLAKRMEQLYLGGRSEPLDLDAHDEVRLVLQQLRDEAHRFALIRHRRQRRRRRLATELLSLPGVGPRRAQALLRRFGSVDGVRAAGWDDLASLLGHRIAGGVWQALRGGGSPPEGMPPSG